MNTKKDDETMNNPYRKSEKEDLSKDQIKVLSQWVEACLQ